MCGIAGIIAPGPGKLAGMQRMLAALRHRGPDGEGTESDPAAILGHRRLSIIDLEGGRQPLTNADRSIWLVCNGEIYNHQQLRATLEADGYRFLTHSDSEVIIALYERHGDRLLEHLRGMFAFGLWDANRRRFLAARDHLGQKPFYFTHSGRAFAFGSEIKALLAFDPSLRTLNLEALDQYLTLRLIAPPHSMFRGVHKLPPGHLLVLDEGREPLIRPYWDLRYQPKLEGSEDSLLDELEERLEETLRLHMVSDVPVGAFLSGGLDSSLLVAMLAKRIGVKHLPTFTVGLPYAQFDEAPHARTVARRYDTEHHEQTLSPSLVNLLPDLVYHLDEPSDPLSLCAYHVSELASRHVKVVIGGDGGDELFGGYDRYYGNLYASHYSHVPAPLRRHVLGPALSLIPEAGWYKSMGHQLRWLQRLSFLGGGERYAASLSYFYFDRERRRELYAPEAAADLLQADPEAAIRDPFERAQGDLVDRMLYADSKVRLPDHPVMITDRMSMAHGLEARSPFMDHRLAEFVARLRSTMKIRGRSLRIVERRLAARYLPEEILSRPKQGFSSALPYILQREYPFLYDRFLTSSVLVAERVLRKEPIDALLKAHLAGKADHGNRLWLLINAELWYRMMIKGDSRESLRSELCDAGIAPSVPPARKRRFAASVLPITHKVVSGLLRRRFARAARPFLKAHGLLHTSLAYKRTAIEWEPGAESVVVLAPHMDDETIGCGGTIAKHRARGAAVQVVFLTDGRQGSSTLAAYTGEARRQKEIELVQTRKREARLALQTLGVNDHVFLDAEDGLLKSSASVAPALREILEQRRPDLVYVPFFLEQHADHWAATAVLLDAVQGTRLNFQCMSYEVWTPLFPNCLVKIDDTFELKKRALAHYASQLEDADYIHSALGLSAYRASAFGSHYAAYAEAFCSLPLDDYRALFKASSRA